MAASLIFEARLLEGDLTILKSDIMNPKIYIYTILS
jgi:hypothetical protein